MASALCATFCDESCEQSWTLQLDSELQSWGDGSVVQCLPCKHEGQGLDPQHPTCQGLGEQGGGVETGESPEPAG